MGNEPIYSIVRGKELPFTRHEIPNAILISDTLEEEPSFSDIVNDIPQGPQLSESCVRSSMIRPSILAI